MDCDPDPTTLADLPPGYSEEDPYAGDNLSTYPEWWRRAIQEFREYGMRPYRPPRFADGELTTPLVLEAEARLGKPVRFHIVAPELDGEWRLVVGDDVVASVDRVRHTDGYSVYGITSGEFLELLDVDIDG